MWSGEKTPKGPGKKRLKDPPFCVCFFFWMALLVVRMVTHIYFWTWWVQMFHCKKIRSEK